jgi:Asp-tRNA(Asn)/Glu-tRNA(Gln) amidotransferase A subunit family amidase
MGSYAFEHFVPEESALIVERLLGAGAIMVGKTTTPEFAYSSFTESPLWGVTRNPWDTDRTPGGSSGGSGAAVASGCVPLAEGTDMGGSVRIPAAWCGVVGLKPSYGRIPLDFLPTQFDTIHHFGPLARTVEDARLFLSVAEGPDRGIGQRPKARPRRRSGSLRNRFGSGEGRSERGSRARGCRSSRR